MWDSVPQAREAGQLLAGLAGAFKGLVALRHIYVGI